MTVQPLVLALVTILAGYLMIAAGTAKRRLVWRNPDECRRCRRSRETCSCRVP